MNTTISENWEGMLKVGEKLELEYLACLQKYYPKAYKIVGNFKFADLCVPELKDLFIEVKQDLKSDHTGNLAIEYQFMQRPSGLSVTKSQVWVMADKEKFYNCDVEKLKAFLRSNWQFLSKVDGGDDLNATMVLVNKKQLANQTFCCTFKRDRTNDHLLHSFLNYVIM